MSQSNESVIQGAPVSVGSVVDPQGSALRQRYGVLLVAALILVVAPYVAPVIGAGPDLLSRVLIWGLFGLGFDLLFGYTGLLSFGQAAFYGTGSFITAYLLTVRIIDNTLLAFVVSVSGASMLGLMSGYLALRRSGSHFAVGTLAFAEMIDYLEFDQLRDW